MFASRGYHTGGIVNATGYFAVPPVATGFVNYVVGYDVQRATPVRVMYDWGLGDVGKPTYQEASNFIPRRNPNGYRARQRKGRTSKGE